MSRKPWDAQLATWLVRPLVDSWVHPNVLTTVRLAVGLGGAALFASGSAYNLGAVLIVLSNFLDHTDGELARLSGKTTSFGHLYDLWSDAVVTVGIFVGLGIGLEQVLGDSLRHDSGTRNCWNFSNAKYHGEQIRKTSGSTS